MSAAVKAKLDALKGKAKGRGRLDRAHIAELRDACKRLKDKEEQVRAFLLEYYRSIEGLAEIAASVHRDKTPEQVVDSLVGEGR
jgi:hypothetical protein